MTAQCGQYCAIATHVDMTSPLSEPRYGTKLISPAAMPIRSPCLSPNSVGAFAVAGARLRGRGSFKTGARRGRLSYPPCAIDQNATAPNTAAARGHSMATAHTAMMLKAVPTIPTMGISSRPLQHVGDRSRIPLATPSRRYAPRVKGIRYLPEGARTGSLGLADDGQHVGREPFGLRYHRVHRALAGHVEPRIAQGNPASLGGRESGARGDQRTLLLGQCSRDMSFRI